MSDPKDVDQADRRASTAVSQVGSGDDESEAQGWALASSSVDPGSVIRQVLERHAASGPSRSRFGIPGRLVKKALLRLIRFYTDRQAEFNQATVEVLDRTNAGVSALRREVQELHSIRREIDELRAEVESLRSGSGGLQARNAAERESLEKVVFAQGRQLDDVTGRMVHFTKAVTSAQADARDVGSQIPRLAEDLRARISALERDLRPDIPLDHFDFARRFRGDEARIEERMERYARLFGDARRVVDLGCGRGEFLSACRKVGIGVYGIDADPDMVSHCRLHNFEVGHGDIFAHLESVDDRSLDGIFSAQVIEHLTPPQIADLVQLAADKLKRGALFVAETIDPNTFSALRWYHLDLTHRQPVPSETLSYLLERAGFEVRDVLPLSPLEEAERLARIPDPDGTREPGELVTLLNRNVDRLNQVLFGPQDYAVIAER